jgi:hypothetical protein
MSGKALLSAAIVGGAAILGAQAVAGILKAPDGTPGGLVAKLAGAAGGVLLARKFGQ